MRTASKLVTAAGGVVWRTRGSELDVLVVHRPRYDDWTLPKGKLLPGEPELLAAVREVQEEVGAEVAVQQRIATVRYDVGDVRKKVSYWSMRHRSGLFVANDEVDDVAWLGVAAAADRMSYPADRSVLADFAATPVADALVVLVRHAKAGKRSEWRGDDRLRPLDEVGEQQAAALAGHLRQFVPTAIHSADRTRCVCTVQPLAEELHLDVQVDPRFNDDEYATDPDGVQAALMSLAKPGTVSVVCSQGEAIPALVDSLGPGVRSSETRKGAWWVLPVVDGEVVAADYYDAPLR
jgi:8-oxo-dGTP pyrophosphatase MutT (NUDIX family)/phosphohistidine phosphatase SixA